MQDERDIFEAGSKLIEYAANSEEHGKYGTITELFPYIYEASKGLGIRAISRWLKDTQGIAISPATISRALRNSESQWEGFAEEVLLPHALRLQEAYNTACVDLLFQDDDTIMEILSKQAPMVSGGSDEEAWDELDDIKRSLNFIWEKWYCLNKSTRLKCYKYFRDESDGEKSSTSEQLKEE